MVGPTRYDSHCVPIISSAGCINLRMEPSSPCASSSTQALRMGPCPHNHSIQICYHFDLKCQKPNAICSSLSATLFKLPKRFLGACERAQRQEAQA